MAADGKVKCVVWDLDDTLWSGTLLEGDAVRLRPEVVPVIQALDERGILHSIASRNDHAAAMGKLDELGLADYFIYPQIHWGAKSDSLAAIAGSINIGIDALAFVDDQPFELDEVRHVHPAVLCLGAEEIPRIPTLPAMQPRFVTDDSRRRRQMYRDDIQRNHVEASFSGPKEEFLAGLGMVLTISLASEQDLRRAEELTVRTHQLNTTGRVYSYEELDLFRQSDRHLLLVASLEDRYGPYGKIGLTLVERGEGEWRIKLLLMSCRVMARGVGAILITHLRRLARDAGVRLRADWVGTDRNRMMYVTYRFAGFRQVGEAEGVCLLENDLSSIPDFPPFVEVRAAGGALPSR